MTDMNREPILRVKEWFKKPNRSYDSWRVHSVEEVVNLNVRPKSLSPEDFISVIRTAPLIDIPYSLLDSVEFAPVVDLSSDSAIGDLDTTTWNVLNAITQGDPLPFIIAETNKKGINILDGWTRAAVLRALGLPIRAKPISKKHLKVPEIKNRTVPETSAQRAATSIAGINSSLEKQLLKFLKSGMRTAWLTNRVDRFGESEVKIYVRKSYRPAASKSKPYISGITEVVPAVDIANINVIDSLQKSGIFTTFLKLMEHEVLKPDTEYQAVYIENVYNTHLKKSLMKQGYDETDDGYNPGGSKSYIKLK